MMIIYGFTVNQNQRKYEDIGREFWEFWVKSD